jgi:hypothetical protein
VVCYAPGMRLLDLQAARISALLVGLSACGSVAQTAGRPDGSQPAAEGGQSPRLDTAAPPADAVVDGAPADSPGFDARADVAADAARDANLVEGGQPADAAVDAAVDAGRDSLPDINAADALEAPRTFDPRAIAAGSLLLWLDASQVSSVQLADATHVNRWSDLSGLGHHAAQAMVAMQPTISRAGALQLVHFEQSQRLIADDKADLRVDELTLFVVCRSTIPHSPIIGYPVLNATGELEPPFWRWTFFHSINRGVNIRIGEDDLNTPPNQSWETLSTYSYRTLRRDLYVNGNSFYDQDGEKRIEYPTLTYLWIGGFAGDAAEILLYRGTLSDADRREVEQYLVRKWANP